MLLACWIWASWAEVTDSSRVTRAVSTESIVSEAIKGEDRVKRPAWDWCGDMPGRFRGGLLVG
jgi:hypothetical protein